MTSLERFSFHNIDRNQSSLSACVKSITTPRPILWMTHQFPLHWIRMYVFQFHLFSNVHVRAIEKPLPEAPQFSFRFRQTGLCLLYGTIASFSPHFIGYLPFQYLQNSRRYHQFRLADQLMYVFRHHHITNQLGFTFQACFVQDFYEQIPSRNRVQQRPSLKTTERNEVKISTPGVTLRFISHQRRTVFFLFRVFAVLHCGLPESPVIAFLDLAFTEQG